ncbi:MAG: copper resistance protein NlpE N-terminal domain-containing protein [Flavobacteriales bacterium]|nr:copper resistance protein NlpE N-terminal domain-containing protein [Flavobacteriales bacterium]
MDLKPLLPIAALALLATCGAPSTVDERLPVATDSLPPAEPAWAGTYADTVPCADCPGIFTVLELREDSTYVLRRRYLERDSIPYGEIGEWSVAGDRLTLTTADAPMGWSRSGDVLEPLDAEGKPIDSPLSYAIRRVGAMPASAMYLTGGYVYYADSHSLTPCGSKYAIPVAMDPAGIEGAALELERTYGKLKPGTQLPVYVRVVATLREGSAMEGDGTDEYLYLLKLEQVLERQGCQ